MRTTRGWIGLALAALAVSCGGGGSDDPGGAAAGGTGAGGGLTPEEMELGFGPIRSVELGELDAAMAAEGESVFALKCSACHKLAERYVGPPLGEVLSRRTPEYVMNMVLNPAEMLERHPTARELLAQYMNPMPDQNLTESDARAVLEYLRSVQTTPGGVESGSE
jgi:mono/diheme cytochrome c family protein